MSPAIFSMSQRVITRASQGSPVIAFLGTFLLGTVLLIASVVIGVGFYEVPLPPGAAGATTKQVGYVWALNWSASFLIGVPAMLFFILSAMRGARASLQDLVARKMVVDADWQPVGQDQLDRESERIWSATAKLAVVVLLMSVGYCLWEWYAVSGIHLIQNTSPLKPGEVHWFYELDWSVAAVLSDPAERSVSGRLTNGVFGLVNYVLFGLYATMIMTFYAFVMIFSAMITRLSEGKGAGGLRLIPDINEGDSRRGFEVFERLFQRVLWVTLIGFLACYFMHVQNLYLRNAFPNIVEFMLQDMREGFHLFLAGDLTGGFERTVGAIFSVGSVVNLTTVWSTLLVAGVFVAILLALGWTLYQSADRSRRNFQNYLRDPAKPIAQLTGLEREECTKRLQAGEMKMWPMAWPKVNQLVVCLAFGFFCIVFFRLGLIFAGFLMARVVVTVFQSLKPAA